MLIDTVGKLEAIKGDLLTCLTPAVDTETTGLNPWGTQSVSGDRVIGIAVKGVSGAYYFPFRHAEGLNLPASAMEFFKVFLSNPHRTYRGFNYKFDLHALWHDGVPYAQNIEDGMLAVHLLNENEPNFRLKDICDRYHIGDGSLQESILKDKVINKCHEMGITVSLSKTSPDNWKSKMWVLPASEVEPYACDDVILTDALIETCIPALKEWGLYDIWREVNYYSNITTEMENRGMMLDESTVNQYLEESDKHKDEAYAHLERLAGMPINPNSPKQVCRLLGIDSSASEILDVLSEREDALGDMSRAVSLARGWASVGSRYYRPYLSLCDGGGVLRTSLNLMGTVSGRLSSNNPNLQAVARKTDVFKVKDVFVARDGYTLVQADYAQAEMRLACWYAQEETMAEKIRQGLDIHSSTAEALGIPRSAAKRINFGVIYGIGAEALHTQLRIEKSVAQGYLNQYHGLYPQFKKLMRACERNAERDGYVRMWTGRCRRYDINNPTHKAMSNLIQGGVAEIMRITISNLHPMVRDVKGYMLLQVHDSIMFEIPDENVNVFIPTMMGVMQNFEFDPKMTVDVEYGKSWGGMQKWGIG